MNVSKLRGFLAEKGISVDKLATMTGIHRSLLYRRMKDSDKVTVGEAQKIKAATEMTNEEAITIFLP